MLSLVLMWVENNDSVGWVSSGGDMMWVPLISINIDVNSNYINAYITFVIFIQDMTHNASEIPRIC